MLKLVVLVAFVAFISASVVPKPPATHSDIKHDVPSVKTTPLHPETNKAAEVKAENKKEENKEKSDSQKSDKKADLKAEIKGLAAVKHHDVPVSVTHAGKAVDGPHKSEKVENAKEKLSEPKH